MRVKPPTSRGGFKPHWKSSTQRANVMFYWFFFWSLETIGRLNISFSLHVWTESCIPAFKVSLQTCPIADINKVIIWARQDTEEVQCWELWSSPLTVRSGNSNCHASLFFGEDSCCLTLNVTTELRDSSVVSFVSQYCACKWEFMFCNVVLLCGFWILKAVWFKNVQ